MFHYLILKEESICLNKTNSYKQDINLAKRKNNLANEQVCTMQREKAGVAQQVFGNLVKEAA